MEYLTARKLQQRFGLPLMDAERIVHEQTLQALYRHPLPAMCWFAAFAVGFILPAWLPDGRRWNVAAKAVAVLLMLGSIVVRRLAAHNAILDASRKLSNPTRTDDTPHTQA